MRTFYHIDLSDQSIKKQQLEGEDIVRAGRYLIAKTLVAVSHTHLRAHETEADLVCRLLLEKKK